MFDANEYLADQFRRYFPDTFIKVLENHDDETITVVVRDTPQGDSDFIFTMEITSDDNYYRFEDTNGIVITVPFALEQSADAITANVTLVIQMDAYSPSLNDATVDVSDHIVELLREHCGLYDVAHQTPEELTVCLNLTGDFKVIQP